MQDPETTNLRSISILAAGLAWLVLFGVWLTVGHVRDKFNLWTIVIDARLHQAGLRLILEIMSFIVATTALLIIVVRDDGESAVWAVGIYAGTYSARSVIGALAGAKAAVMVGHAGGGWQQQSYPQSYPPQQYSPPPVRVGRGQVQEG